MGVRVRSRTLLSLRRPPTPRGHGAPGVWLLWVRVGNRRQHIDSGYKGVAHEESGRKNPLFSFFFPRPLPVIFIFFSAASSSFSSPSPSLPLLSAQLPQSSLTPLQGKTVANRPQPCCSHVPTWGEAALPLSLGVSLLSPQEGAGRPVHGPVLPHADQLGQSVGPPLVLPKGLGRPGQWAVPAGGHGWPAGG